MKGIPRFVRIAMVASLATVAVACGGGGDDVLTVTSQVVSDPTTPDLRVLAPDGEGPWPVVVALHGFGGTGQDMVELGTRLAKAGVVVFVPTYNTDLSTPEGLTRASDDIVCAYQVARRIAPEHGGDLTQPVTVVGWSLGADFAVLGVLGPPTDSSTGRCPGELPRPDVAVALAGCYYEFEGNPVTWFDDLTGWSTRQPTSISWTATTTPPAPLRKQRGLPPRSVPRATTSPSPSSALQITARRSSMTSATGSGR